MKKRFACLFMQLLLLSVLLALLIVNPDSSVSDTVLGEGHIISDTVWNVSGSPYFIEGNITVDYGVNLTIEAGVEVRFNGYYCIYIEGNLSAVGNISNMIKFTSNKTTPSSKDWDRLQINETGHGSIRYCNITYASLGISVSGSSGNDIQGNYLSNNDDGVHLYDSLNNTILSNNISGNTNNGIFLERSSGNIIQNNTITNNLWHGVHLYDDSDENNILGNNVEANFRGFSLWFSKSNVIGYNVIILHFGDGVQVRHSHSNVIRNNNISLNANSGDFYGINLNSSLNNLIFHNTLMDNANHAYDDTNNGNRWNDSYPGGGNYWDDYTGEDINRSANQDVPGPDGIGDTNYTVDSNSADEFPLMKPSRNIAPFLITLLSPHNESIIKQDTIIDLDILVQDFEKVNYSVNGGANISLSSPFNISTTTWDDGGNRLDIYVIDINGNVKSSWFFFILDPTKPEINLVSPLNNSIIKAGEIINISISDSNIKSVDYYINGTQRDLLFPYYIDTSFWPDDSYGIDIHAEDIAGNMNSSFYVFTTDTTPPEISLKVPANNSHIKPGTPINFSISDEHLDTGSVYYTVDGDGPHDFTKLYNINTTGWGDGHHAIVVNAADILGNVRTNSYNMNIDSQTPLIILNEPQNNSQIRSGTPLNFSVIDASPFTFNYSLNMRENHTLPSPYDINTSMWSDGAHIINVTVTDYAGNVNQSLYLIIIDTSKPIIIPILPSTNFYIREGINIAFNIYEPYLSFANYSVNGGEYQSLIPSMVIETTDWPDGPHAIEVYAVDSVGNNVSASFIFNMDNSPPRVVFTMPHNQAKGVSVTASIVIGFNELMNKDSVKQAIEITPEINYTLSWSSDNLSLTITPLDNLANNTMYTIVIDTSAHDLAGNTLTKDRVLSFSTEPYQEEDLPCLIVFAILVIILLSIVAVLSRFLQQKEKEGLEEEVEKDEFEVEAKEALDEEGLLEELGREETGGESGEKGVETDKETEEREKESQGEIAAEAESLLVENGD